MKKHVRQRLLALLLTCVMVLGLCPAVLAAPADGKVLIDASTQWKYLDDGTDPAGDSSQTDYDRYRWTGSDYDDSGWRTGQGPFGAYLGRLEHSEGNPVTTLLDGTKEETYKEESTPAYFFRTTVELTEEDLAGMNRIQGHVVFDDAVIVYINGQEVAQYFTIHYNENVAFGSERGKDYVLEEDILCTEPASLLHAGENIIAVELHQDINSTERSYLKMDLALSSEELPLAQKDIGLYVGRDESEMNFSWYSNSRGPGQVRIAERSALESGTLPEDATVVSAQAMTAYQPGFYSYQATVSGLKPGTTYSYQLTNGELASAVYEFTTARSEGFSFAFAADPQLKTPAHGESWANTLGIAANNEKFKDTSFLLVAGDQVDDNHSEEAYDWYFNNAVLPGLPQATVIGNHDSGCRSFEMHYNLPNESQEYGMNSSGSSDYYFVHNNVLFLMLNSQNTEYEQHAAFMREAIEKTKNMNIQWKVAAFHHSIFSVATHSLEEITEERRNALAPLFKELDIDVVFMGHDHSYTRTYMMDGVEIASGENYSYDKGEESAPTAVTDPKGILYITGNCASTRKFYDIENVDFPFSAVQNQDYKPNISRVDVTNDSFTVTTYCTEDMSVVDSFTIKRTVEPETAGLQINHVYGGGGKGETPIANSFIELYNPTANDIGLKNHSIVVDNQSDDTTDFTVALPESVEVKANSSYLIVGASESTSDDYLTYDLPEADQTDSTLLIDNKRYTIKLMSGETEEDTFTATGSDPTKISKQKSLKRDGEKLQVVVWEKENGSGVTINEDYVAANAPRNSKGAFGSVHTAAAEPTYTPVVTNDARVTGYYDATGSLKLTLAGRYDSQAMNADGGSLEIVQYNAKNGFAYAVSGLKGKLIAADLNGKLDGDKVVALTGAEYDVKSMVSSYGDMTSVAISPDGTRLAVAIQAANYDDQGSVALFACQTDGSLKPLSTVKVGVQPDMLTFADNSTILTADEGEPRRGVNGPDPKGSVTVVTIAPDTAEMTANSVYFDAFDVQRDALTSAGVLIQEGIDPSTDLEPEYIAVSGRTAYVALQEANAIAVLNIDKAQFTGVYPLGFQDYGKTPVDLLKNDNIELTTHDGVYGIKMPDGIAVTTIGGKTYLLTANEGDSRADWTGMDNESEGKTSPTGNVTLGEDVVWFNAAMWDGLDQEKAYVFGGRSFSLYEVSANGLTLVYDSGSDFETITAEKLAAYFNCSNDKISLDNRSGKKGPEPEGIDVGVVNGRTYAFIGLERIGGVMVYDISDPANVSFVNYINSRDFSGKIVNDVSPEGLCFVSAADSKTGSPLLLAACEVSGTMAAYELTPVSSSSGGHSGGSGSSGSKPSQTIPEADVAFADVKKDAYYFDAVAWAVKDQITAGTSTTEFSPDALCTRAQIVTFLWRAAGSPEPKGTATGMTDVDSGGYYEKAVAWAIENGITTGMGEGKFSPDATCTRAQAVTFLARALNAKAAGKAEFSDVPTDSYFAEAVAWAASNGVTEGVGNGLFAPDNNRTRGQIVTFLWRTYTK